MPLLDYHREGKFILFLFSSGERAGDILKRNLNSHGTDDVGGLRKKGCLIRIPHSIAEHNIARQSSLVTVLTLSDGLS